MATSCDLPSKIVPLPISLSPFNLLSNFYVPAFDRGTQIHVYSLHFTPEVEHANRALRHSLLDSISPALKAKVGGYVLSGLNLFAIKPLNEDLHFSCRKEEQVYALRLSYSHPVPLVGYQAQKDNSLVLNVIIKKMLRELGLLQVTKLPKYYDPRSTVPLKGLSLEVWRGFSTELNYFEGKPLVTIDFSSKIVHIRTLLDVLGEIRDRGGDWVEQATCELEGRIVMAKYGNRRCYRVDQICVDKSPLSTFPKDGAEVSYIQYFSEQYGQAIRYPRQPLILSRQRKRLEVEEVYLVPELMTLTGLDESMRKDYRAMAQIAEYTRLSPSSRSAKISDLSTLLNTNSNAKAISTEFQFSISREPVSVQAYNISGETIYFSNGRHVQVSSDGNFQVREDILETVNVTRWVVFASDRDQEEAVAVIKKLHSRLEQLKVTVEAAVFQRYNSQSFRTDLQRVIASSNPQIAIILLNKRQHDYDRIKALTTGAVPILTQVISLPMNPKRFNSIIEKVALQVQAKLGAQLWTIRPSNVFGKFLMVVGIDVFHDTVQRGKSVLALCATIHPNLSKYYSTTSIHATGQEISNSIGPLFRQAIEVFKLKAKRYPETVVVFRDGVAESQTTAVRNYEVSSLLRACEGVQGSEPYSPRVIYTVVVKNTGAKFFFPSSRTRPEVSNPAPGTIVLDRVVPETGDFYLIAHSANQGMASPSLYRTVFTTNKGNFPLEELARLAYKLCHMYYNWCGAIKVPAPCMMAHKLAYLVGKFTHNYGDAAHPVYSYYL